jgi:streptogramin lyase
MNRSLVLVLSIGLLLCVGVWTMAEPASLTLWNLPYATAFPAGLALGDDGTVFFAAEGGSEVFRLDPANDTFRSWGVSEHPRDVTFVDGIAICTVRPANHVTQINPDGLGVGTSVVPFPDMALGEIHRGADTDDGKATFWISAAVGGFLRYEYDPANPLGIFGDPMDGPASRSIEPVEPVVVAAVHEVFAYDVRFIPDPVPFAPSRTTYPFTEWRLPLGDDFFVQDLAVADDGSVWISFGAPFLYRFDPSTGSLNEYETVPDAVILDGLLPWADGSIWFGDIASGSIAHFNPTTGLSERWRIPGTVEVYDLAFDAGGGLWYSDRVGATLGRLDLSTGEASVYRLPEGSEPLYLAIDDAGDVWFTAGVGNYIGRLTPAP